jgi:hypothetical protein
MLIAWSFKHFSNISIFVDINTAFAYLNEVTYTCYTAAALLVANFERNEEDVHVIQCTDIESLQKFKWARNEHVFLWQNQYIEENFALTWERIPVY